VVICLERGADYLHMVQLMPLHPKTPPSVVSYKSKLVFLPFWYQLTQVVLGKRPLSGRSSSYILYLQPITFYVFLSPLFYQL